MALLRKAREVKQRTASQEGAALLQLPAVLLPSILAQAGARGCCRASQCCKSLQAAASADEIWEELLARQRHAKLSAEMVDLQAVPGGPIRGRHHPPYSEASNVGARQQWVETLAKLDRTMPAKAKYRALHVMRAGLQLPACNCNMFYRGYLTPGGEYDICDQKLSQACGVKGCAACFCDECLSGSHPHLSRLLMTRKMPPATCRHACRAAAPAAWFSAVRTGQV